MSKENSYKGPLSGVKVLDFGHYYAGPMVAMLLADQGAEVVRITKSGAPEVSAQQYRVLNRNKKLLSLNLKTATGYEQAVSLVKGADIVIENFRPGVMRRLGLDYACLKKINPRLVYLSLPGFSSQDKGRSHIQAWEGVLGAAACMYTESHASRKLQNFPPLYHWMPLCSVSGAIHGAMAAVSALISRLKTGVGAVIEVPLVNAGLSVFGDHFLFKRSHGSILSTEDRVDPILEELEAEGLMYSPEDGEDILMEKLTKGQSKVVYGIRFYSTLDNRKILIGETNPVYLQRAYEALGIFSTLRSEGFVNVSSAWDKYGYDNNLSGGLSEGRRRRVQKLLEETLRTKTANEWEVILEKTGVNFSIVRSKEEWLSSERALNSGLNVKMDNGTTVLTVPGRLIDVSGPSGVLADGQPKEPLSISFNQAKIIFQTLSNTVPGIVAPGAQKKSDLLEGLKVLDLSGQVAGPTSTYTLAQYGATVIKSETPTSSDSPYHLKITLEVAQGKRSILVDMHTAPGQEILRRLVRWADVVVHNILDKTTKRLGVSHQQLLAINPNVVGCQFSCMGGTWRCEDDWRNQRGDDGGPQLRCGIMSDFGTEDHPQFQGGISNDCLGGVSLALSAVLGRYQQLTTGVAGEGRASLARASLFKQLIYWISEDGNCDWGETKGQFVLGEHWWQRLYRCRDQWMYVGTHKNDAAKIVDAVLQSPLTESADKGTEQALETAFRQQDYEYWSRILSAAGIACHRVLVKEDISQQYERKVDNKISDENSDGCAEVLRWDSHPAGVPVNCLSPNWVLVGEGHSFRRLAPGPVRGTHTRDVLSELDYSDHEIEELLNIRAVFEYLPALGNKETYFFS